MLSKPEPIEDFCQGKIFLYLFLFFSSSNMPRMRGADRLLLSCCPLLERVSKAPIEVKLVPYTTKYEEMR